ncbi:sensor histidine kinase [Dokdonella sp.]|uniref:sensor histidine kinase n=1 Tax=Dokdonella sp. TaxID=2291710 RepID=UPI003C6049DA
MRWPKLTPGLETRLRIVLLVVAVLASVALPYGIIRSSADRMLLASEWVVHSANVRETLFELGFQMSELESLVLGEIMDIYPGKNRPSYEKVRARIKPLFDRLDALTRDNIEQHGRIGSLRVLLDGRLDMLDIALQEARNKNYDAAMSTLNEGAKVFGSREISWQIVSAEEALFKERNEKMAETKSASRWAIAGALIAQLLLLGSVVFVSERQAYHRRSAEAAVLKAIERSRLIVQTMREPIVVLDPALRVLMTNEAFREIYGGPADDIGDISLAEVGKGSWDDPDLLQRLTEVGARGREIWDYELEQCSADNVERTVLVNARRMDLSDDSAHGAERTILLTVSDVTARKRSEERIYELNENLEAQVAQVSEVNRELESFSYSVSHDLRAPLRHIAGFTDKLGSHIDDTADEKARHYLQVIGDAARRMSTLIENLLEYSRLGRNSLRIMPVDMDDLVGEVRGMLLADESNREIEWQIGDLPAAMGDESMLRQVWQNLIGNALKYTSGRATTHIEISADSSRSDEVVYSVRDNGTGFDMAYSGKLFGVFQRLHKASEFPGTGIGLANVRRIVGRHGGRVWAESEPDKGATFHFSLPALAGAVIPKESRDES